jgi:hypothetical protein
MRTTVNFDEDVMAAIERRRRERAVGLSEAVNELVRAGLTKSKPAGPFEQQTHDLGEGIDVSNIGEALETLDGPSGR